MISVDGLQKTDYSLTEISAPEGFTGATDAVRISASDFSTADQTARITLINHPVLPPNNTEDPKTLTISGRKTWVDNANQDGLRPASITIRLLADGQEVAIRLVSAQEDWRYQFTDLPQLRDGKLITYSLVEDPVAAYVSHVQGYNLTNTHVPQVMSLRVTKVWQDAGNVDGLRPQEVTMHLYANGQLLRTFTISRQEGDSWVYDLKDLPKYAEGQLIRYTVAEEPVAGYVISYNGLTVTNSHQPNSRLPQTGDNPSVVALLLGMGLVCWGFEWLHTDKKPF